MRLTSLLARAAVAWALVATCSTRPAIPEGQCVFNGDCASPLVCAAQYCRQPCRTERDCSPAAPRCRASGQPGLLVCLPVDAPQPCVYTSECGSPLVCARDGICRAQCRADYDCRVVHPHLACAGGTCEARCPAGADDCDGDPATGCEAALATDVRHCGTCGRACPAPANGAATCVAAACGVRCDPGFAPSGGACVRLPAPRPVAPLSTARVTSRRPTLRWRLATGTTGARVEVCRDRGCAAVELAFDAAGTSGVPATDLAPGAHYWRLRGRAGGAAGAPGTGGGGTPGGGDVSPTWQFFVPRTGSGADASAGAVGDYNGDGRADLAVGAPFGSMEQGAVYVYLAGAAGMPTNPTVSLAGGAGGGFGAALANAGDVNGDGYADLLLGESGTAAGGSVRVHLGSATGIARAPAAVLDAPDGPRSAFGASVAGVGDVNGDGYADAIVGAPGVSGTAGATPRAYVFHGGAAGLGPAPAVTLRGGGDFGAGFGVAVTGLGDADGDGFADVAVGAVGPGRSVGGVFVFRGGAEGVGAAPAATLHGPLDTIDRFGAALAGGGDFNGDGLGDLAVGAPESFGTQGRVHVYLGRRGGFGDAPGVSLAGLPDGAASYGAAVAVAGDTDGDGRDDLASGGPSAGAAGLATISRGSDAGPATRPSPELSGLDEGGQFGRALAGVGDVDGDGFDDVVVGAPGAGRVHFYRGSATGLAARPAASLAAPEGRGSGFGLAIAR